MIYKCHSKVIIVLNMETFWHLFHKAESGSFSLAGCD